MTELLLGWRQSLIDTFSWAFGPVKFIAAVFSIALALLDIYIILRLSGVFGQKVERFKEVMEEAAQNPDRIIRAWKQILMRFNKGDDSNLKLAVIEADKLFDEVLKRSGFQGESMGDRMTRITPAQISNIEALWQAHKLRNRIVHEPDYELNRAEAELAVNIYRQALEELGIL
jgi:hypothetical protein